MDKADRETRDFMNVESFSQLPFIRPVPPLPKEKGAIRLFGKEFACNITTTNSRDHDHSDSIGEGEGNKDSSGDNTEPSSRKFECHYCCRNFPTSQALGGHQNAHKRERQQAKRAHLQSAMVHDAHVYGLMNYSRLGSTAPALRMPYHSWSNSNSSYGTHSRLFGGGHGSYSAHLPQPINGSPLGLCQGTGAHNTSVYNQERHHQQIPMFNSKDEMHPLSSIGSGSQFHLGYRQKPNMQDHMKYWPGEEGKGAERRGQYL